MRITPPRSELLLIERFSGSVIASWMQAAGVSAPGAGRMMGPLTDAFEEWQDAWRRVKEELFETFPEERELGESLVHCELHGMDSTDMIEEFKGMCAIQQLVVCWGAQRPDHGIKRHGHFDEKNKVHLVHRSVGQRLSEIIVNQRHDDKRWAV